MIEKNCDCKPQNNELVQNVQEMLPDTLDISNLSDFLKIMSDNTRLKILFSLQEAELCVSDLANVLDMTKSAISHQLKTLRIAKLVKARKDGKTVYYSLEDQHVQDILAYALTHIKEK